MRDEKKDVKDEHSRPESSETQTRLVQFRRNPSQIKNLNTELQNSEAWYRALYDNANDAIFLMDYDRFNDCNPKTLEMFGCTKEQIIGQRPYARFSPGLQPDGQTSKDKALEKIRLALEGQPQLFEWRHLRYDGTPFEAEVSLNRVKISEHFYIQAFVRDITKQKHTHLQYEIILKTAMDGFGVFSRDGNILEVNDAYCNLVGYSREELLSMNLVDIEASESTDRIKQHIIELMDSGSHRFETRHKRKDGKFIDLEVSANNLTLDGCRLFAFFRDITERKKAEVDLRRERDKAQKYLDVAGVIFVALDKEGIVTLINQKGCEILCHSEKNIIGKNWFDNFLPKELGKEVKRIFEKLMTGKLASVEYYENPILTKSGEEKQIAWHNTLLQDKNGRIIGTLSSGEDITERKKAEMALSESEQRFRKFFEYEPEYCYMISPEGVILEVNSAALNALGYTKEELVGKPIKDIYAPESQEKMLRLLAQWKKTGEIRNEEMVIITKSGQKRIVLLSSSHMSDENKKLLHRISIQRDITERKQAEKKLREHEEQLKSLASELSLAEERERRRIAAGIHDDIAQRLALAKLELQSIQNRISDSNIISSLKNQCGIIDRIMEDARSLTFELSNPLLYEIGVETAIESFLTEQIQEKFGLKCKFTTQGPQIHLDEDIRIVLYQGVRELLTNIVKHANASRIEVRIVKSNTEISIIVNDDGIGLNQSKLSSPERNKGGFGLLNIRERLEYLGGNLNIQSAPNKGACVTMSIPLKLKVTAQ